MKLCLKILAVAVIAASTYPLVSCAGPAGFSYQSISITITTACSDCPATNTYNPAQPNVIMMTPGGGQGSEEQLTATVANAPANVTWTIYPQPNLTSIASPPTGTSTPVGEANSTVGSFATAAGNATSVVAPSVYYSAGSGVKVPVYSGAALQQAQTIQWNSNGVLQTGIPQGDVLVIASVPSDPSNPSATYSQGQLIQMYSISNPSVYLTPSTGSTPPSQTQPVVYVARGASYQFYGGTVGAAPCIPNVGATACPNGLVAYTPDNASIWYVGPTPAGITTSIPGGNTTYGTISSTGLYTAPSTIPSGGNVIVYVGSHLVATASTPNAQGYYFPTTATSAYAIVGIY